MMLVNRLAILYAKMLSVVEQVAVIISGDALPVNLNQPTNSRILELLAIMLQNCYNGYVK
jgi:hypothetical protein